MPWTNTGNILLKILKDKKQFKYPGTQKQGKHLPEGSWLNVMHTDSPLAELIAQNVGQCCCGVFGHAVGSHEREWVDSYKPKLCQCILQNQNVKDPFSILNFSIILRHVCYHSAQNLLSSRLLYRNVKIRIYKTIVLPTVLYGCESCSLTLREEHRLRVFENRVLRRIFGWKRDEVTGKWRKLHNKELHDLYSSPSIIRIIKSRRMRRGRNVARMGRIGTRIGYRWESQRERATRKTKA
jgi:hypothetical protein